MSELKTYDFPVDHGDFTATVEQFYLKSEADKVIAHHKYKRCLAMAKYCKAEQTYSSFAIYITEHPESRWANKSVGAGNWIAFWKNREQRWLELAEKFKEAK